MKKIIAINAGPRTGWNTDQLIKSAAEGAEKAGAEVEYISLYKLEKFTGCISCLPANCLAPLANVCARTDCMMCWKR